MGKWCSSSRSIFRCIAPAGNLVQKHTGNWLRLPAGTAGGALTSWLLYCCRKGIDWEEVEDLAAVAGDVDVLYQTRIQKACVLL
jgi:hypothetical protein